MTDEYTHRPGGVEDDPDEEDVDPPGDPAAPVERGRETFQWRDWTLIGVVVLCFLVLPATIIALPPVRPFRFAYLVLPLIPAVLLGAVAVWSAQRSRRR